MHYLKKHLEEYVVKYLESQTRFVLVEKAPFLVRDLHDNYYYAVRKLSKSEFDEKKEKRLMYRPRSNYKDLYVIVNLPPDKYLNSFEDRTNVGFWLFKSDCEVIND